MDYLDGSSTIATLFPSSFIVAVSDSAKEGLKNRFPNEWRKCSIGTLLRLTPEINDINNSVRDPTNGLAPHQVHRVVLRLTDLEDVILMSQQPQSSKSIESMKKQQQLMAVSSHDPDLINSSVTNNSDPSPWFTSWKTEFLSSLDRFDHEFIGAYFGCIFVILSADIDDFRRELTILQTKVNACSKLKFFFSSFIRYFVVLHVDPNTPATVVKSKQSFKDLVGMYSSGSVYLLDVSSPEIIITLEKDSPDEEPTQIFEQMSLNESGQQGNSHNDFNYRQEFSNPISSPINPTPLLDPLSPLLEQLPPFAPRQDSLSEDKEVTVKGNNVRNNVIWIPKKPEIKPVVCKELNDMLQALLRQLVESSLIPFIDKQVKILYDNISNKKGFGKQFTKFLGIRGGMQGLVNSSVIRGETNFKYRMESDEMQQRKIADMVMSVGLFELANRFYQYSRDDFRADGACIYFAGASEMTAVTAFLMNKQSREKHQNFDNAITTYLDICKQYDLACRSTLLMSECMKTTHPNETAHCFIRMTSEDCDLKSALFLEQAALSFRSFSLSGPTHSRARKSCFHSVLAGHRYNKCNLKRHALHCYRVFNQDAWYAAIEHVNFTVAKLMLTLSSKNSVKFSSIEKPLDDSTKLLFREQAMELFKRNTDKVVFFTDLIKELTSSENDCNQTINLPNLPCVKSVRKESPEGTTTRRDGRHTTFLSEPLVLHVDLINGFPVRLCDVNLFTSDETVACSVTPIIDFENDFCEKSVTFSLIPSSAGNFDILGMEFTIAGGTKLIRCKRHFNKSHSNRLRFLSIQTLPPVQVNIRAGSYADNVDAVELMSGETVDVDIRVNNWKITNASWRPSSIRLFTNAQLFRDGIEITHQNQGIMNKQHSISLNWAESNIFTLRSPIDSRPHLLFFKIEYFDESKKESRTVGRSLEIYVRECLIVESVVERVVSLRNTLSTTIVLSVNQRNEKNDIVIETLKVWPGLTAHILVSDSVISWSSFSRQGFLSLEDTQKSFCLNNNSNSGLLGGLVLFSSTA